MGSETLLPSVDWGTFEHATDASTNRSLSIKREGSQLASETADSQQGLLPTRRQNSQDHDSNDRSFIQPVLTETIEKQPRQQRDANENPILEPTGQPQPTLGADNEIEPATAEDHGRVDRPVIRLKKRSDQSESGRQSATTNDDYERATGETLQKTLDIDSWNPANRLAETYGRFEREVADAVKTERLVRSEIRKHVLPLLSRALGAPRNAGHFKATLAQLRDVQNKVLFNGLTEAVDGTSVVFETLPVKMVQIGIGLLNYRGDSGSWGHRIFRRDVRMKEGRLVEDAIAILERRSRPDENAPSLTDLLRRAVMTYGERAILTYKAESPWRMGHGNPLAYELLTGSGDSRIIRMALPVLRDLVLNHKKFVFVPSVIKDELLLTVGNALLPLEYTVVKDFNDYLKSILGGHYRGEGFNQARLDLEDFSMAAGSELVMGVFRASPFAPSQVFYAHAEHAHEAALIAMADAMLVDYRGFPMLLDLADRLCAGLFGNEALIRPAIAAFAHAEEGTQYLPERKTRVA
ncbi:MAG: hypothetical protein OJF62_002780 [Pseudolabrys sp.]|jgi:hypothetical protein|nr:hypothetical protein [Pseudolabrys sp.]